MQPRVRGASIQKGCNVLRSRWPWLTMVSVSPSGAQPAKHPPQRRHLPCILECHRPDFATWPCRSGIVLRSCLRGKRKRPSDSLSYGPDRRHQGSVFLDEKRIPQRRRPGSARLYPACPVRKKRVLRDQPRAAVQPLRRPRRHHPNPGENGLYRVFCAYPYPKGGIHPG